MKEIKNIKVKSGEKETLKLVAVFDDGSEFDLPNAANIELNTGTLSLTNISVTFFNCKLEIISE
jgi:hypothetical protein